MNTDRLQLIFNSLQRCFGPRHWWPADSGFEVAVGAILTQNTAWTNVEQAIDNLRSAAALSPAALCQLTPAELEALIRPAGFFRQKTRSLHEFTACLLNHYDGNMSTLCSGPLDAARRRLLAIRGIGPETADSILLYAANRPTFVVDAYTRRIFARLGLLQGRESYAAIRSMFMEALPAEASLYNEYHALIVAHAKTYCRKRQPLCKDCPLLRHCPYGQSIRYEARELC